jgi:hypothetical protein
MATTKTQDALNRAVRTIIQFIVIDVVLIVVPQITNAIDNEDDIEWDRLGLSAIRVALGGVLAYVMRLKVPPQETPPPVPAPGGP